MCDNTKITFQVMDIIRGTTVDGPGFRTSIYLAGCDHHCPGCHNPSTWDPRNGDTMTLEEILAIVREEDFDVTLSGGDPLFNPDLTAVLASEIKQLGKKIWLYTGYTIEQINAEPRLAKVLEYVDTVVDGPFIEEQKNPDLLFRGSTNQRIIEINAPSHKNGI
ncbi:MAG: anaerobic ribonucleoside-triphosphate reductase activating protein [Muribaculaceae bacterium]|nr:anaerobic ribonucleoside-triphosphate reductase activating protein [Muribaculaceae bacterium]